MKSNVNILCVHCTVYQTLITKSYMTTNLAKDDGNMQILIFHMYHIGLLPFKIYYGRGRSLLKYTLGAPGVFQNILWALPDTI